MTVFDDNRYDRGRGDSECISEVVDRKWAGWFDPTAGNNSSLHASGIKDSPQSHPSSHLRNPSTVTKWSATLVHRGYDHVPLFNLERQALSLHDEQDHHLWHTGCFNGITAKNLLYPSEIACTILVFWDFVKHRHSMQRHCSARKCIVS
nr:hypothetical protein CFP56_26034 [Quercus suber]